MSKTAKIEARVLPARLERYRQAADALKLEEMSDYVRRACDELAERTDDQQQFQQSLKRPSDLGFTKPDPKRKR